jgi:hypothetical protein
MRSRTLFSLLCSLLALAATSCGGPVLFVEADLPHFCITQAAIAFPAAPGGIDAPPVAVPLQVPFEDQIPLLRTSGAETELHIDEIRVTPRSGNPDLSGVAIADVNAVGPSGASVRILSYARDAAAPPPAELVLAGDGVDVAPYLVEGQVRLQIIASGRPPTTTWSADVKTCAHGRSKVPYLP